MFKYKAREWKVESGKCKSSRRFTHLFHGSSRSGFTLVELIISIGIFAMMTALFVVKYGTFNQSVLLTSLAYDVALTIRTAQTYGLSIKSAGSSAVSSQFQYAYGVNFSKTRNQQMTLFGTSNNSIYDYDSAGDPTTASGDVRVSKYVLKRGAIVSDICVGTGPAPDCSSNYVALDVVYKRPDPSAIICAGADPAYMTCGFAYAELTLLAVDGNTRKVSVRKNGQISVLD